MPATCTQCGAPLLDNQPFCTKCGGRRGEVSDPGTGRRCTACGAALSPGTKFCEKCGALTNASPAIAVPAASSAGSAGPSLVTNQTPPAPGSGSGSKVFKLVMIAIALFVFILILAMGSCAYVAYRAKQKAERIEAAYKQKDFGKVADELGAKPDRNNTNQSTSGVPANPASPFDSAGGANSSSTISASAVPPPPSSLEQPGAATGDPVHDWALRYERTVNGPEADLVVRTGDINNLGFGWPKNFDPFSGKSTYPHPFPWSPKPGSPDGTDRMLLGSAVTPADFVANPFAGDGYTGSLLRPCMPGGAAGGECTGRKDSMPQPIVLPVGGLPAKIDSVLVQIFVDDFQAPSFHSHFQASLNGTRIPSLEQVLNAIDQTGPIGKLITVNLLPEYFPLLQSGALKLLIDDPTTHAQDAYAIDFVRILVNPHKFSYLVSVAVTVTDFDKSSPIAGATVTAATQSASTDSSGKCVLNGLPAGLVVATAVAPGYDANSGTADVVAGQSGHTEIMLHHHQEGTSDLEKSIAQTGSAAVYGIHFDTDSAKLRPDSTPALESVLGLINNHPGSRWIIEGHTDNQGNSAHNQTLSQNRAASVIAWLKAHGVDAGRLTPQGFGATRPVEDNATANGRALNRRVEIAAQK